MKMFQDNPQAFNSYSYVGNNPLILVDPTGESMYGAFMRHLTSVNERTNGRIAREIDVNVQAAKKAGVKFVKTAAVTLVAAYVLPEVTSSELAGAVANVGERLVSDYRDDGQINDDAYQYIGSSVIGSYEAKLGASTTLGETTLLSGAAELAEQVLLDDDVDPAGVVGHMVGTAYTKNVLGGVGSGALSPSFGPFTNSLAESVVEGMLSVKISDTLSTISVEE